jgi:FKBP-type peptidyl-prolyl cis-trans isomerase
MKLRYIAILTLSLLMTHVSAQETSTNSADKASPEKSAEETPAASPEKSAEETPAASPEKSAEKTPAASTEKSAEETPAASTEKSAEETPVADETSKKPADETSMSQTDKLSYSIGYNIGKSFKQQEMAINIEVFVKAIQDVLSDQKPILSEQEVKDVMLTFKKERFAKMAAERKQEGEKNLKEGKAFLEENAKKEGVVTLTSGLQYKVITLGTGQKPTADDKVTTHYRGTLIDGTEFDSSYKREKPATFPVKGVIAGWTEALQLMKEGAKWQLFIPSNLAYGERGSRGKIGSNATLIFEIELISIVAPKTTEKTE